jgi:DNA primase
MPGIDYRELRRRITMREVLDLLGFQPASRHGVQLRGPCPIPGCRAPQAGAPSDRSFSVHLTRQIYRCFACHSRGNVLDLWAAARELPLHYAALDLCRILTLDPPWLAASPVIPSPGQSQAVPSRAPARNR